MNSDVVIELGRQAIETVLLVATPLLGISLVVGLAVSIVQAMTQINEATLSFVPKMLIIFIAGLIFLPWMLDILITYTTTIIVSIPLYSR